MIFSIAEKFAFTLLLSLIIQLIFNFLGVSSLFMEIFGSSFILLNCFEIFYRAYQYYVAKTLFIIKSFNWFRPIVLLIMATVYILSKPWSMQLFEFIPTNIAFAVFYISIAILSIPNYIVFGNKKILISNSEKQKIINVSALFKLDFSASTIQIHTRSAAIELPVFDLNDPEKALLRQSKLANGYGIAV